MPRIVTHDRGEEAIAYASAAGGLAVAGGELVAEGASWVGGRIMHLLHNEHQRLHASERQRTAGHIAVAQPGEAPQLRLVEPPIGELPVSSIERPNRSPVAA